jgi:isocitrate dehydrogenase
MEVVFYGSEKSVTVAKATDVKIEFVQDGKITVLKESTPLKVGEIIDSSVMHLEALKSFVAKAINKEISCYQFI